jgi:hypothetical protein
VTVHDLWLDGNVLEIAAASPRPRAAGHLTVAASPSIHPLPVHAEPRGTGFAYLARLPLRSVLPTGGRIELMVGGSPRGLAFTGKDLSTTIDGHDIRIGTDHSGYLAVWSGA